jgi:hypothetical protein
MVHHQWYGDHTCGTHRGAAVLPTTCVGSISSWNERDTCALTIINNCLDNHVVSHSI